MNTNSSESGNENQGSTIPASRTRSPAYPGINLEAALGRAQAVWNKEQRNAAPVASLAAHWESNQKSSVTLLAVSALKKFGLLEEIEGKERLLKLTPFALNILLHEPDAPERAELLKEAALKPKIHADLWGYYKGVLPSDSTLRHHLLVNKQFNRDSADGFIKQFRDTIKFAKLTPDDKVIISEPKETDADDEPKKNTLRNTAPEPTTRQSVVTSPPSATFVSSGTVAREFTFPVPSGTVVIKVPFPLSEADYSTILRSLKIFKEGIVKQEVTPVQTSEPDWQAQAEALAKQRLPFTLVGFSYVHHINFYNEISIKYNLKSSFDPTRKTATFSPEETEDTE